MLFSPQILARRQPKPVSGGGGGGGLDAATTAWVNAVVAAGGTVSDPQKGHVDALIVALKGHGLFALLDRLWLWAAENTQQAGIDIVGLHTWTNHGLTFDSSTFKGYSGDGSSAYGDSGFSESTGGGQHFLANSAMFGIYMQTAGDLGYQIGGFNDSNTRLNLAPSAYTAEICDMEMVAGPSDVFGLSLVSATSSSAAAAYLNGTDLGITPSGTFGSLNTVPTFILARNSFGSPASYSADQLSAVFFGGGLDATQALHFSTDLNAYMTSRGVNVY